MVDYKQSSDRPPFLSMVENSGGWAVTCLVGSCHIPISGYLAPSLKCWDSSEHFVVAPECMQQDDLQRANIDWCPFQSSFCEGYFRCSKYLLFGAFHCTGLYYCSNRRSKSVCGRIERWATSKQEWVCNLINLLHFLLDWTFACPETWIRYFMHKVLIWKETPTMDKLKIWCQNNCLEWYLSFKHKARFPTVAGKIQFTWHCKNHPFLGSVNPWEKGQVNMSQIKNWNLNNGKISKEMERQRNYLHCATRWCRCCWLWPSGFRAMSQSYILSDVTESRHRRFVSYGEAGARKQCDKDKRCDSAC